MSTTNESQVLDLNLDIEITSQEGKYNIMPEGDHVVTCTAIATVKPKESDEYKDVTPQVELQLQNEDGQSIRWWLNTKGFKRFDKLTADDVASINPAHLNIKKDAWNKMNTQARIDAAFDASTDQNYAISKITGERVESPENTAQALGIFGKLANHCGAPTDTKLNMQGFVKLVSKSTFGIHVYKNAQGQPRVKYSMTAESVGA